MDFFDRRGNIVFDPPVVDGFTIEQHVTGPPVSITRLSHRPHVTHDFSFHHDMGARIVGGINEIVRFGKDARHVSVPEKTKF